MQIEKLIEGLAGLTGKQVEDVSKDIYDEQDGVKVLKDDAHEILIGHVIGHFREKEKKVGSDKYNQGFKEAAVKNEAEIAAILGIEIPKGAKLTETLPGHLEKFKQPTLTWETIKADPALMEQIKEQTRQSVAEFETKLEQLKREKEQAELKALEVEQRFTQERETQKLRSLLAASLDEIKAVKGQNYEAALNAFVVQFRNEMAVVDGQLAFVDKEGKPLEDAHYRRLPTAQILETKWFLGVEKPGTGETPGAGSNKGGGNGTGFHYKSKEQYTQALQSLKGEGRKELIAEYRKFLEAQ